MKPTENRTDRAGQIDDLLLERSSQEPSEQELSWQELSELNVRLEIITDSSTIDSRKANDFDNLSDPQLAQAYAALDSLLSEVVIEQPFRWKGPAQLKNAPEFSAPAVCISERFKVFPAGRICGFVSALAILFMVTGWAVWRQYESGILFRDTDSSVAIGVNNSSAEELLASSSGLEEEQDMADWNKEIQDSYWDDSFEQQLDSIEYVITSVQSNSDSDSLFKQAYWDGIDFQEMDEF